MMAPARVLVVDDSPTMRGLITAVLNADPDVNVVGQAGDAMEARNAIKQLNPDVVTLDIEMPNMNGLEFLDKIMKLRPMPVIMVSTLTHRGAEASLMALEIGAFDCVGKPRAMPIRGDHRKRCAKLRNDLRSTGWTKIRYPLTNTDLPRTATIAASGGCMATRREGTKPAMGSVSLPTGRSGETPAPDHPCSSAGPSASVHRRKHARDDRRNGGNALPSVPRRKNGPP